MRKKGTNIYFFIFFIIAIFNLVIAFGHEYWRDETQAWLIARDTILTPNSLFSVTSYEGHPFLWFLVLMPFAKLGFSVCVLKILSYLFVMVALYLFLFKTDFPLLIKIVTAFSPLFICYLVIPARSYSLAEFLLVFLMVIYKEKINKPIICGILLALLLQTLTIYAGFVFACSVVWLIDALVSYRANAIDKESFLRNGIGMTIVFFSALFLLWEFRYVGYAVDTLSGNSSSFMIDSVIFHVFDMANGVFNGYYIFASLFVIFVLLYTTYRDIRFLKSVTIIVVG